MSMQEFHTSKETTLRNHLARRAASGESIAASCRDEAISKANFHAWRTKQADGTNEHTAVPTLASTFIDLGAVSSTIVSAVSAHSSAQRQYTRHRPCPALTSASFSAAVAC